MGPFEGLILARDNGWNKTNLQNASPMAFQDRKRSGSRRLEWARLPGTCLINGVFYCNLEGLGDAMQAEKRWEWDGCRSSTK